MISTRKDEAVGVLGYDVTVRDNGLCIAVDISDDGETLVLNLYPEESKRLRKALKRAERRMEQR